MNMETPTSLSALECLPQEPQIVIINELSTIATLVHASPIFLNKAFTVV